MARDEAVNIAVFDTAYREFKSLRASQLIFFWRCDFTDVYALVSVVTTIIVVTLIIVEVCFGFYYYKNPFLPRPERVFDIDISGRRNVEYLSLVDDWINTHAESITAICADLAADTKTWYEHNLAILAKYKLFRKHRQAQFNLEVDNSPIRFEFYRLQTRYTQSNYVCSSYKVKQCVQTISFTSEGFLERYNLLRGTSGNKLSMKDYDSSNQRRLMTPELREQIKQRDNYTCQLCGKYMPDEVGLEIDHIIPVSKGGKTTPDNLQVLCSKCNRRKSNKI